MAKITTFLVVFVAIFCGWPCLLHFMAGEQLQICIFFKDQHQAFLSKGFARTGAVLSSVTGCLVFQSGLMLRCTIKVLVAQVLRCTSTGCWLLNVLL